MVSLPLAFITTQAASFLTSTSRNMALHEHESVAVTAVEVEEYGSTAMPPSNPIDIAMDNGGDAHSALRLDEANLEADQRNTPNNMTPIHFCFIVHGHQGRPTDLSYLHHAVKSKARNEIMNAKSSDSCVVGGAKMEQDSANAAPTTTHNARKPRRRKRDRLFPIPRKKKGDDLDDVSQVMESTTIEPTTIDNTQSKGTVIVHNAACNEGKTHDGIIKGGERLANEMLEVIRSEVKKKQNEEQNNTQRGGPIDVTISIVGNSLGGLYGRYAIAQLAEVLDDFTQQLSSEDANNDTIYYLMDGHIRIHLNVFCSTASPHLGCASHTYIPIPRTAELGVAQVMGETGSDLFRTNDLVHTMATSPRFLKPLASFRRRIAYANAYNTDFPVPCATAAFLDANSDYPHYFDAEEEETIQMKDNCPASERGLIAAILHTPRLLSLNENHTPASNKKNVGDLAAMSSSLDSLGWKKVFIDIRSEIPAAVSLPTMFKSDDGTKQCPIRKLKSGSNQSVRSRDLERAVSTTSNSYRLGLPLGHNAICAFSRGTVSTAVNSGGRPVMDSLAIDLTNEISLWRKFN